MEEISNKMKIILILLSIIPIIIVIFFLGLIVVNAQERIQSIPLGYTNQINASNNGVAIIYSSTSGNFANWGRGYLSFSIAEYWTSTGTSTNMTTIREIDVTSSGNIYTCDFGSVAMDYNYEDNVKVVAYSVICDVTMGANGLQEIRVNHSNGLSNAIVVKTSDYMTFTDNLQIDTTQAINNLTSQMQTYLQTIINQQTSYTQSINTTITNIVNTNFNNLMTYLSSVLGGIKTEQEETNDKLDEIKESDISASDKEQVDDSDLQDYEDAEGDLMDYVDQADLNNVSIGIPATTSTTIWTLVTRLIHTHPMIYNLFISILSIGIIKLALAR